MKNSNIPKRHHQKVAKVKPSSKNGLSFDQKVRNVSAFDFDFSCLTISLLHYSLVHLSPPQDNT
jgi:hypothetical protein